MPPFLHPSILFSCRVWARQTPCRKLKQLYSSVSNGAYDSLATSIPSNHDAERPSFQSAGIRPGIAASLAAAFPQVKHPTEMQLQLIQGVLSGKDLLLKDQTGTGKSLGLILALLSKDRMRVVNEDQRVITSLLIVPHRELAVQFLHWIQQMIHASQPEGQTKVPLSSVAQLLVRDTQFSPAQRAQALREQPPHILIATPNALLDVQGVDPGSLQLETLSSVVVDDADYLIPTVNINVTGPGAHQQVARLRAKLNRHIKPTVQILDSIFATRIAANRSSPSGEELPGPQLILASATLRNHLRHYAYIEKGWLRRGEVVRVTGQGLVVDFPSDEDVESTPLADLGGTGITHCALVVSADGSIRNLDGAIDPPPSQAAIPLPEDEIQSVSDAIRAAPELEDVPLDDSVDIEKYAIQPSPFNPAVLEAIATVFALDVPSLALLVIPASGPVKRAAYELRTLGINAIPFDASRDINGENHLLKRPSKEPTANATLLVSTAATVRGVDLPGLSHVFILGLPQGRTADSYLHIAGRVGRFWRGGKVVSFLEEGAQPGSRTMRRAKDEASKLQTLFKLLEVTPVKIEHFE